MRADNHPLQLLLLTVCGWVRRNQQDVIAYLVEENRVLKEQMKGRNLRLNDDQRRRLATKGKRIGRRALNSIATIVTPDTIMRLHRQLVAQKWTHYTKRVGRPGLMKKIAALIVIMAYILFVLDLKTRSAHIAGITTSPDSAFVAQVARNLTDFRDCFLRNHRFVICDRDTKFTKQFKRILGDFGVDVVMIDEVKTDIMRFTGDAVYDTLGIHDAAGSRGARVIVPPSKSAIASKRRPRSRARDRTIRRVKKIGRRLWKKESGCHLQGMVENAFFRCKLIVGDRLRARQADVQKTETAIACNVLNRMLELGRAKSRARAA